MNNENDNTAPDKQNNPFMNIISGYLRGIGGEPTEKLLAHSTRSTSG